MTRVVRIAPLNVLREWLAKIEGSMTMTRVVRIAPLNILRENPLFIA
jgi:hypothetical protein